MIDTDNILDDKKLQKLALWTGAGNDANDLAYVAEFAIAKSINLISVVPDNVKVIWPWLENSNIKIYSRFYLESKSDSVKDISELTKNINMLMLKTMRLKLIKSIKLFLKINITNQ